MAAISKILLPIDLQVAASAVPHQAAVLARRFDAEVVLLHVVTPLSYSGGMLPGGYVPVGREDLMGELIQTAEQNLDQVLKPELAGLRVRRLLRRGDAAEQVALAAREENASMIMMPTHGYRGFRRLLLGSVTAKVLHDVACPVWTGAHLDEMARGDFAIRQVLCAIDLNQHSRNTLRWASWFAAQFGASLTIVHVTAGLQVYGVDGAEAFLEWNQELSKIAIREIAGIQQELGLEACVLIENGDVPRTLSHAASVGHADLLVIGRRSCDGRLGSGGYGIIRESRVPVLSI